MEVKILNSSKDELEVELDSITIAEILRIYLNMDSSVTFAAWKREHPTKNPVMLIKTKGKTAKKAIEDAVSVIEKELDKFEEDFKKMK
ncbi:MAG TPA: RpoL/Rpb11 RNA polymerase subunit family protein [Candidatus Omnitrophota bacterium]|nr:RpoL/Rpb11 RNA polymerase subunit family protein [Candidatus Omnitrophota bacterium]